MFIPTRMPAIYYGREVHVSGRIFSFLPDGTAPFDIISTTLCTNLNSDLLDGEHAAAFQGSSANLASLAGLTFSAASFVKMTSADTFALDTNVYLTAEADTLDTVTGRGATTANALTTGAITLSSATGVSLSAAAGALTLQGKKSGGSSETLTLDFDENEYLWPTFSSSKVRVNWKCSLAVESPGTHLVTNSFRATNFDTVGGSAHIYWAYGSGTHASSDIVGFIDEISCDTTNGSHKAFCADGSFEGPTPASYYGFYGDSTLLNCPAKYGFYLLGAPNYTNGATTIDANLTLGVTADRVLTFAGATDNCVLTYTSASNLLSLGDTNLLTSGTLGAGITTLTGVLNLRAGTATAGTAPLKFTSGTLLTTPEVGALEYLSGTFYIRGTDNLSVAGTLGVGGLLTLGVDAATNTAGSLKLWSAGANNYYTTITAGEQTANSNYVWPVALPTSNKILQCTDAGVLSWVAASAGYTNLTEFVGQTNWSMFYSDGSGDVKELTVGAAGKVLTGNGVTAAPTWETAADDTAYSASWDGVTTVSPSKNAIYDQLENIKATVIPQDITAGRVSFNTELGETTLPTFLVVNAQTGSTFALDTTNVRGGRWKSTTGNKDAICSIDSKYKYFLGSDTPAIESSFTPLETIPNDVQYGIGFWAANHVFAGSANCAVICARYGGNVALVSVDNAGNVEVTGSSIALPAANVAMHLKVVLYANKVEAYVNGVLVMTNSTRVPSSSVALYASIGAIRLNVPGTVGNADWDYYLASQTRQ